MIRTFKLKNLWFLLDVRLVSPPLPAVRYPID